MGAEQKKKAGSATCPVETTLNVIGGRWKPVILYFITEGVTRFSGLKRAISGISEKMLAQQLKGLEQARVLERTSFNEMPPRVEYRLTSLGETLLPVIDAMCQWGKQYEARAADSTFLARHSGAKPKRPSK